MPASFDLIPFDPGNDSHAAFVYDTFRKSCAGVWPWSAMPKALVMAALKRELAKPGTVTNIAVPKDMPDSFLGWYSARPADVVVYGFTKYSARRQGVATGALVAMGVTDLVVHRDLERCIGVAFWTPAAARLAAGGKPLYFDTREAFDDAR